MEGTEVRSGFEAHTPAVIHRYFIAIAIFWTLLIVGLYVWEHAQENRRAESILLSEARPFFNQIITTRAWNAGHGGVYVPVTPDNPPNPYLKVKNRDLTTTSGLKLTLVNPAYMTRQISELAQQRNQVAYHLTSERPIRPGNQAATWELDAMRHFSKHSDEYFSLWHAPDGKAMFRYMAPVWMSADCISCHGAYGYKQGDMGGGLSVTFPAGPVIDQAQQSQRWQGMTFGIIWLLGITGLGMAWREIGRRSRHQEVLIQRLEGTLQGLVPICSSCKSIRNESGDWEQLEQYITDHSDAEFSHGLCPSCADKLYGEFLRNKGKR